MVDRRTALLDAAVEHIASRGTRGLRVEDVARSAGVSTTLIYHHFGDRSNFLRAALEHIGDRADGYTSPTEGLAKDMIVAVIVDEIQEDPTVRINSIAWGELRDSAIFDPELRPTITEMTDRWIGDIADLVRAGHEDGSIDPDLDPDATGTALTAFAEAISGRWLSGQLSTDAARRQLEVAVVSLLGLTGTRT